MQTLDLMMQRREAAREVVAGVFLLNPRARRWYTPTRRASGFN